jgi:hypothetical protein
VSSFSFLITDKRLLSVEKLAMATNQFVWEKNTAHAIFSKAAYCNAPKHAYHDKPKQPILTAPYLFRAGCTI